MIELLRTVGGRLVELKSILFNSLYLRIVVFDYPNLLSFHDFLDFFFFLFVVVLARCFSCILCTWVVPFMVLMIFQLFIKKLYKGINQSCRPYVVFFGLLLSIFLFFCLFRFLLNSIL